ncbi:MAG TPA: hypothetical protein VN830_02910 [Verrucomicrobiae bacterium]|nr:hypothetical protein [Verrucomicrobiae bacterium]
MKRKWVFALLSEALLVSAGALRAQEPPAGAPPPDAMGQEGGPEGPLGPRMEILGFGEMHPGKVVTGAPYSGVAVTETRQTLADGNTISRKVQANVFRDSQGRTRRETTLTGVGPLSTTGASRTFVMIHDPVAGTAFVLHQDTKVAEKLPARQGGRKAQPDLQSKFNARMQAEIANGSLKKEDLGVQIINGINAQGTRFTRTIPAGQAGNSKPIVVTNERWYSPDLQIVVKTVRNDPRFGETTYTVTNIQKQEPAAALFTVPSDYTVKQGGVRGRGKMNHPGGLGAAPADMPPPPPGE